jgi:hypothetical protein
MPGNFPRCKPMALSNLGGLIKFLLTGGRLEFCSERREENCNFRRQTRYNMMILLIIFPFSGDHLDTDRCHGGLPAGPIVGRAP